MLNRHFGVLSISDTTRQPATEHRILWQEGTTDICLPHTPHNWQHTGINIGDASLAVSDTSVLGRLEGPWKHIDVEI